MCGRKLSSSLGKTVSEKKRANGKTWGAIQFLRMAKHGSVQKSAGYRSPCCTWCLNNELESAVVSSGCKWLGWWSGQYQHAFAFMCSSTSLSRSLGLSLVQSVPRAPLSKKNLFFCFCFTEVKERARMWSTRGFRKGPGKFPGAGVRPRAGFRQMACFWESGMLSCHCWKAE